MNRVNDQIYGDSFLDIAGPQAVGKAFNEFLGREPKSLIKLGKYIVKGYKFSIYYFDADESPNEY